jgi:putative acetyltransferase
MIVREVSPAAAARLIASADAYMESLYPSSSNHLESIEALQRPNVAFFGAFADDDLAACGAVKLLEHDVRYGEIKRLYVDERYRGKGLARALMDVLERHAVAWGARVTRLETGIYQPEALALYRALGYVERPPFADYRPDPLSVFMEKRLG